MGDRKIGAVFAACVAVFITIVVVSIKDRNAWEAGCRDRGGHVSSHTGTHAVLTYDSRGNPSVGTATDTTYYCLSSDGRILDIR